MRAVILSLSLLASLSALGAFVFGIGKDLPGEMLARLRLILAEMRDATTQRVWISLSLILVSLMVLFPLVRLAKQPGCDPMLRYLIGIQLPITFLYTVWLVIGRNASGIYLWM